MWAKESVTGSIEPQKMVMIEKLLPRKTPSHMIGFMSQIGHNYSDFARDISRPGSENKQKL